MIQISELKKSFGGQILYDNITFNINSREKIGLVGRNGHGKTTLFHIILGKHSADSGSRLHPKGYRIGYLEQHINFTQDTVLQEGCLGLREEDKYETWKVEKILSGLGFSQEDMDKPCSLFPRLPDTAESREGAGLRAGHALLDEPNNYLDIVTSRWLTNFLRAWRGELMLITHDRGFMDSVVTHTLGIHRTKIRKVKGDTEKFTTNLPSKKRYMKDAPQRRNKRAQLELFIARFKAKAAFAAQAQSEIQTSRKDGREKRTREDRKTGFFLQVAPFDAAQMMSASESILLQRRGALPDK